MTPAYQLLLSAPRLFHEGDRRDALRMGCREAGKAEEYGPSVVRQVTAAICASTRWFPDTTEGDDVSAVY